MPSSPYRYHVFCCTNQRPEGHHRGSCLARGGGPVKDYLKRRCKELGIEGVRINAAGCLDRCEEGPVIVVYPEGTWYRCGDLAQAEQIVQEHLLGQAPVAALKI